MRRKRSTRIIVSYVLSLLVTIVLLFVWVAYIVRSSSRSSDLAQRLGLAGDSFHWTTVIVGCALFFLLIVGLTYQLAQTFAERRYSTKQEEFVSNITHEMQSPMAAIKLHAQTLQQGDLSPEDQRRSLGFILQQANRMGNLVDNVLESSRLLTRRQVLELKPLHLQSFFSSYFDEVRARFERQGVRIKTRIDTRAVVMATVDSLHRVMDNLLDNAVRFSERGGEVRCHVSDGQEMVRIEVEDDGVGIPKGELSRIFDRFYQIGSQISGRRRGTGLGLFIVSGLVREMKGRVRAVSYDDKLGTRFVIELPVAQGEA